MIKHEVWSTHTSPRPERDEKPTEPVAPAHDALEVTRTDRKVAENDASILKEILHRKSWINEVKS